MEFAKQELREETFNHSMRVFYYGMAIKTQQSPSWRLAPKTYLLTCFLHDIGTTDENVSATLMSFEFHGGLIALDLLHKLHHAPIEQAEAVTEAVIRHQDIGGSGKITELGQLIQLAMIFDNLGGHADLVHKGTIENVVEHPPRKKWSSCFATTIRKEIGLKPWAHTTALGEKRFPEEVERNNLMAPYDG
ncbi:hypothetical protein N7G274_004534 [Stereocaulon virgatum]|uniref:HD domain-containing protein n=1 Tax=Stereocaulon virgatum TaxID=373712 RepID=A0ABR4ABA2_9LECA